LPPIVPAMKPRIPMSANHSGARPNIVDLSERADADHLPSLEAWSRILTQFTRTRAFHIRTDSSSSLRTIVWANAVSQRDGGRTAASHWNAPPTGVAYPAFAMNGNLAETRSPWPPDPRVDRPGPGGAAPKSRLQKRHRMESLTGFHPDSIAREAAQAVRARRWR
jgi:hypothetical protein